MLLFKNGLRKLLREYVQFSIYIILVLVSVVFTSTFGIVSSNLIKSNDTITKNFKGFDYSYRFNSSGYKSNDTQTFSPWFAFNTKINETQKGDEKEYFQSLNFGDENALKKYIFSPYCDNKLNEDCYLSSVYSKDNKKQINFHFGDVEGTTPPKNSHYYPNESQSILNYNEEQKINVVKKGEFGDLFKFNFDSNYFLNSLIGNLYKKFDFFNGSIDEFSLLKKDAAINIFNYMFYLNNSFITYSIKYEILEIYNEDDSLDNRIAKINELVNNGFNKVGNKDLYYINNNLQKFSTDEYNLFSKYSSIFIRNYESENIFKTLEHQEGYLVDNKHLTSRNWFDSFNKMLSNLTNFTSTVTNEVVMWGNNGEKYRYISSFYNKKIDGKYVTEFYNNDLNTVYEKLDSNDVFTENSFLTSIGHFRTNNMRIGESYNIFPGEFKDSQKYRLDGSMSNALNLYPTIYEEDLMVDQNTNAIFYISTNLYGLKFRTNKDDVNYVDPSKYQDVSRVYLKYIGQNEANMNDDIDLYKLYLADNILNLGKIVDKINNPDKELPTSLSRANVQGFDELSTLGLRSTLFDKIVKVFYYIAIAFSILFILALCFVINRLFKRILDSQRSQIGNLKSLGYSNFKIILNYISYMCLPLLLIIPIGWSFSIGIQKILTDIFAKYFDIPNDLTVNWIMLLSELLFFVLLIGIIVFTISYIKVNKSPLKLLEPPNNAKPRLYITKIFSKFKTFKFTSKLRNIIFASSIRDLVSFFFVVFVSTIVLLISSITPNILSEMSNEFYKNMTYNNEYSYSSVTANNPLSKYTYYDNSYNISDVNNDSSIFNVKIKDEKTNTYHSLLDKSELSYWRANPKLFAQVMQDSFLYNLATFKGILLSPSVLDYIIELSQEVNPAINNVVKQFTNTFACKLLPQLFNQQQINDAKDYNDCIKLISGNIIPSSIKENWDKDENSYKNFSFNFSKVPYNVNTDSLYTRIDGQLNESNKADVVGYGLDFNNEIKINIKNKSLIKYNENNSNKTIPILVNKKMALKGYSVGKKLNIKMEKNYLTYLDKSKEIVPLDKTWWSLENSKEDIWNINVNKLSYWKNSSSASNFYYTENGEIKEYFNPKDILLKLPKNLINNDLIKQVNEEYYKYSNNKIKEDSQYYYVHPYDIYVYENDGSTKPLIDQIMQAGITNSWLNIALKNSLFSDEVFYDNVENLEVVGVEDLYDGYKFYLDQYYANILKGYESFDSVLNINDNVNLNSWSDSKITSNDYNSDQLEKIMLTPKSGNNTMDGFMDYMKQSINHSDSVLTKKNAVKNLLSSVVSISIIFISISMIAAIIVIFLITDIFIGRYKIFMVNMRIFGYSMKEINSIMMWIFLPITIISSILAMSSVILLIYAIVPNILLSVNLAVPMMFNYWILPFIFILSLAIFLSSYSLIIIGVKKTRMASLIGKD
ncbi:ABC transporter permease [Spiroplasma turonicum]|uniref:ABC3 transporter permease C-terminal domain-containing protein n=1 Tax=Spiroplasma turonicum TaxID=216946 RepID=A0A0K1P6P8_9MOLU|nr:ABC transporter permease [Spiroplasma turonicum]AKU79960.1 hypothetical protein STURON_00714 [Spiroplasma turonicum]ALX70973.1 ABC transporter permease [Spiroplasma turonicum]